MAFEVGQRVSDYEILGVLGTGGMGRVYRVRNVISDRVEAMKVLLPDLAAEPELANRFIGEIRTLASFDHPNIAQLHTAFQVDNQLVMIMEFVEGFTIDQRVKQGPVSLDEILGYATQVLAALSYAHSRGVVHRDIKPSNMMVTPHGVVKLMDFGIAKSIAEPHLTRPGTTMGSLYYMSPEQVRGGTVDARSDLYSVGISLYELTAGRRPFQADTTYDILNQQLNSAPQPPIELNANLPPALNEIILTSLAKEPMHRFQSADAFRNALQSVRASLGAAQIPTQSAPGVRAHTPALVGGSPPPAVQSSRRGNRGLWMGIGALALVCVVVGGAIALPHFFKTRANSESVTSPSAAASQTSHSSDVARNAPSDASNPAGNAANPAVPAGSPSATAQNVLDNPATAPQNPGVTRPERIQNKRSQEQRAQTNPAPAPQSAGVAPVQEQPTQTAPPVTDQQQQAPAGPSQEELDQLNDHMVQLGARANAVKGSIERLRSEQAAGGLGLRQDISASLSRMEGYMDAAERATQGGNLASAKKNMAQAEKEVEKLEAFFGK